MSIEDYLHNAALLLSAMGLLALIETLLPLVRMRAGRERRRLPNVALIALTLACNFAFNAGAVLVSAWLAPLGPGLLSGSGLPGIALVAIGIAALDGSTYACHRLLHRLPLLWRVHRVHHSDPRVDVTTTLRQHPLEGLVRIGFVMAPAWALGVPPGTVALYRSVSALIGLAEHMNVRLWEALDRALALVICTPNMHKLHHSRRSLETDSNFGNILSAFDRLFASFIPPTAGARVDYGLEGYDAPEAQRLGALLRLPFRSPQRFG
jgi:sterol desaturase/sphingolipid hydroxylase (fatty acid hydroxylase superfamily)